MILTVSHLTAECLSVRTHNCSGAVSTSGVLVGCGCMSVRNRFTIEIYRSIRTLWHVSPQRTRNIKDESRLENQSRDIEDAIG